MICRKGEQYLVRIRTHYWGLFIEINTNSYVRTYEGKSFSQDIILAKISFGNSLIFERTYVYIQILSFGYVSITGSLICGFPDKLASFEKMFEKDDLICAYVWKKNFVVPWYVEANNLTFFNSCSICL